MTAVEVAWEMDGPPDAPVVVLSNSLGSTRSMWDPQVPALARRFRVLRYDHRGHGDSPAPPGPYSLDDLGGDVLALLDGLDIPRAHLCGLSLGGMAAMWVAARAPQRVERLVLCCTAHRLEPGAWAERAATVRRHGTGAVAESVVGRWFTPAFAAANPEAVRAARATVEATPAEGYASCCDAIRTMDLSGDLARIEAPTLVVAGAQDPATPPECARRIAAGIPDARCAVLESAAHLANVERAREVTALLLGHLESPRDG